VTADLDGSDLAELRRRVVDSVLASVIPQGELTVVSFGFEQPSGWAGSWADGCGGRPNRAWLILSADAGHSRFEYPVGKAIFWRLEAEHVAADLATELDEWICLGTKFGWGSGRGIGDYAIPGPIWPEGRVLEVYPDESVSFPVWECGSQMTADELGLSAELADELLSWHRHLDEAASEDSDSASDREFVGRFETWRDELIDRLRTEVGPEITVATPPRIPT
jgi:hypothetical protein